MEPGRYKAQAIDFTLGVNENTGTEQAGITFAIAEGEEYEGETIVGYLYFTEKAAERAVGTLRKMGWTGMDIGTITAADLPNIMELVVVEEEYNGEMKIKVQWINVPGDGGGVMKNRMSEGQRASFSERMRGLAMKTAPQQPTPAPRQATGARPAAPPAGQAAPARQAAPAQRQAAPAARAAAPAQRRQAPPPPAPLDDEDPLPF